MDPDTSENNPTETPQVEITVSPLKKYRYIIFGLAGFFMLILLGAVYLAQLSVSDRDYYGAQTKLRNSQLNLRAAAEVFYADNEQSYEGFCESAAVEDIKSEAERLTQKYKFLHMFIKCADSKESYAVEVPYNEPIQEKFVCVSKNEEIVKSDASTFNDRGACSPENSNYGRDWQQGWESQAESGDYIYLEQDEYEFLIRKNPYVSNGVRVVSVRFQKSPAITPMNHDGILLNIDIENVATSTWFSTNRDVNGDNVADLGVLSSSSRQYKYYTLERSSITGDLVYILNPTEDFSSEEMSETIDENETLSKYRGIRTRPFDTLHESQVSRFAYIQTPSGKMAFVDWPWGQGKSYSSVQAYVSEYDADIDRILREISDADTSTFEVFTLDEHITPFAKDKNHFYSHGSRVPELDADSVRVYKFGSQSSWGNRHSAARFVAIDNDTAYFLGRFGISSTLQTYAPGVLEGVDPKQLSIIKDVEPFDILTTDGVNTYWNANLIPNLQPNDIEYVALYEIVTIDGRQYVYGRPASDYLATSNFGIPIASTSQDFVSPTFIYNSSGVPRELTSEYKTNDGKYIVGSIANEETHRGSVYVYGATTDELLHEADLESQLAGYRMIATSPDEKYMYVIVGLYEFGSYSKLYKIEIATGAVTEVFGVNTMNTYESLRNSSGLSNDGAKLVFTESSDQSYPACADFNRLYDTIKLLDLTTGTVETLYKAEPSQHITEISWLPDESGFTYAIEESLFIDDYISIAPRDKEPDVPEILNAYKISCQNGISKVGKSYYQYQF